MGHRETERGSGQCTCGGPWPCQALAPDDPAVVEARRGLAGSEAPAWWSELLRMQADWRWTDMERDRIAEVVERVAAEARTQATEDATEILRAIAHEEPENRKVLDYAIKRLHGRCTPVWGSCSLEAGHAGQHDARTRPAAGVGVAALDEIVAAAEALMANDGRDGQYDALRAYDAHKRLKAAVAAYRTPRSPGAAGGGAGGMP